MLYNRNLSNINEKDGPKNKKNSILEKEQHIRKQKQPYAKKDIKTTVCQKRYKNRSDN